MKDLRKTLDIQVPRYDVFSARNVRFSVWSSFCMRSFL